MTLPLPARRAGAIAGGALLLGALAAAAYIPSSASLLRRASGRVNDGNRSKDATLSGWLWLGEQQARQATLTLKFPLECRLDAGKIGAGVGAREPSQPELKDDGLGEGALDLLRLACPLIAYRGQTPAQAEQTLRALALAAGVAPELAPTALARLYDRVAIVLGAGPRQLDRPQLWLYKDNGAPARLLARQGERLDDLRLLQYGNPAAAVWFPRVLELWRGAALIARFEALETRGFAETVPGDDDEARE